MRKGLFTFSSSQILMKCEKWIVILVLITLIKKVLERDSDTSHPPTKITKYEKQTMLLLFQLKIAKV